MCWVLTNIGFPSKESSKCDEYTVSVPMCPWGKRRRLGTDHIIRYDENRKHRIFPKETFIFRDVHARCPCACEANVGAWELIISSSMCWVPTNIGFPSKESLNCDEYTCSVPMCLQGKRRYMGTDHMIRYDENHKHRILHTERFILPVRDAHFRCPCAYEANVGAWELIISSSMCWVPTSICFLPKNNQIVTQKY